MVRNPFPLRVKFPRPNLRRWSRLCGAIGGIALLSCRGNLPAEDVGAAQASRIAQLFSRFASVDGEVANQLAIAQLDVANAPESDGWTPALKEDVTAWLKQLPRPWNAPLPIARFPPNFPAVMQQRMSESFRVQGIARHDFPPPAMAFADHIAAHFRELDALHHDLESRLAEEVVDAVSRVWIEAGKPADLEPILPLLKQMKEVVLDKHPPPAAPIPSHPRGGPPPEIPQPPDPVEDARTLAMLLLPPDPLYFPDPKTDLQKYIYARLVWNDLRDRKFGFVSHSKINFKLRAYDQRLARDGQAARTNLDRAIVQHVPATTLKEAFDHFEAYCYPERMSAEQRPPPTSPSIPDAAVSDYHELLGRPRPPDVGDPNQNLFRPVVWDETEDAYKAAVALLIAGSEAQHPDLTPLKQALRKQLKFLFGDVHDCMETQLDGLPLVEPSPPVPAQAAPLPAPANPAPADPSGEPSASTAESPTSDLIAFLDHLVRGVEKNEGPAVGAYHLLPLWRRLENGTDDLSIALPHSPLSLWQWIAASPENLALFELRDRACRQLLTKICGPVAAEPLPAFLREQLESAISAADWKRTERLLTLDQGAVLFSESEHHDWETLLTLFRKAESDAARSQSAAARTDYRQILTLCNSAAAGKLAAQRLKALPADQPVTPPSRDSAANPGTKH